MKNASQKGRILSFHSLHEKKKKRLLKRAFKRTNRFLIMAEIEIVDNVFVFITFSTTNVIVKKLFFFENKYVVRSYLCLEL